MKSVARVFVDPSAWKCPVQPRRHRGSVSLNWNFQRWIDPDAHRERREIFDRLLPLLVTLQPEAHAPFLAVSSAHFQYPNSIALRMDHRPHVHRGSVHFERTRCDATPKTEPFVYILQIRDGYPGAVGMRRF